MKIKREKASMTNIEKETGYHFISESIKGIIRGMLVKDLCSQIQQFKRNRPISTYLTAKFQPTWGRESE